MAEIKDKLITAESLKYVNDDINNRLKELEENGSKDTELRKSVEEIILPKEQVTTNTKLAYDEQVEEIDVPDMDDFNKLFESIVDIKKLNFSKINLFDREKITNGYLAGDGTVERSNDFVCSDFIDISWIKEITLSQTHIACWYDSSKKFIDMVTGMNTQPQDATITVPSNASYIRCSTFATKEAIMQIGVNVSRNSYIPYGVYNNDNVVIKSEQISDLSKAKEFSRIFTTENLFDKSNITENKYLIASDGTLDTNSSFNASDYIYIGRFDKINLSYTHIACWYDEDCGYISAVTGMNSRTNDTTVDVPTNAKYIRASFFKTDQDRVQIGYGVDREDYLQFGDQFMCENLVLPKTSKSNSVVVAKDGSGDYSSILEALYETDRNVIVKAGTYDVIQEYKDKWGSNIWNTMSESDFNKFGNGLVVDNRSIVFESGSMVVADYSGIAVDSTHRFCPFVLGMNATIDGLLCEATGCWYLIHDDWGLPNRYYTNTIKNSILIMHNPINRNVIGGGCDTRSTNIIENCYMDNGKASDTETMRYHNTSAVGAKPRIYIRNCRVNGHIGIRYYGTQTDKLTAIVNNCDTYGGIIVSGETASSTVNNVDLFAWNNKINS